MSAGVRAARPAGIVKLPFRPLGRETVQDRVYSALRRMIMNGEIVPAQTLAIQTLAESFQVSTTPVREALRRLTAEQALTVLAGRSVGIPALTRVRLADLCRVRSEVEGLAATWAAEQIGAAEQARMAELVTRMQTAADRRDGRRYVPANHEFHFIIYRAANSAVLLGIIESLWLQIGPYFHVLRASDNWQSANAMHRRVLDAFGRHDGTAAAAALRSDINAAGQALDALLES